MKNYQKAQMIAKNLPTGSYAAGCGINLKGNDSYPGEPWRCKEGCDVNGHPVTNCTYCERAQ